MSTAPDTAADRIAARAQALIAAGTHDDADLEDGQVERAAAILHGHGRVQAPSVA